MMSPFLELHVLRRIPCDDVTPSPFVVTGQQLMSSLTFGPRHRRLACVRPLASLHLVTTLWLVAARRRHIVLAWCRPDSPSALRPSLPSSL
ncbi:hypothetical protein K443DRAFT_161483 [Laccaria amethystina LaAM-08-1]|uniref:Uncharacterized protein n=1 Tax=Laccaria amethystina LaAM-08-1 TaxID=1095629 RepID=A0A0C9XPS9_9AGAR|nr:hypothetical protein K443DRAFT_161483 [Laccaria amethystina LaAM-08-1]